MKQGCYQTFEGIVIVLQDYVKEQVIGKGVFYFSGCVFNDVTFSDVFIV